MGNSRRVALITGASGGVGQAVAAELARHGHSAALLYRSNAAAVETAAQAVRDAGGEALVIQADLTDPEAVERAVQTTADRFGGIDVLAHCAGAYTAWKTIRGLSVKEWQDFLNADLSGFFYVLAACVRHMHERKSGSIVAVSSIASQACQPRGGQAAAAKAGLEALVRVVAKEEGRHGIRANGVAIGLTATEMGADAERNWGEEATKRLLAGTPLGRMGEPEEIARVVRFLASDEASYVTGKILQVDGGQIIAG
jgi:NAD(P)-dependent dehydrogenase (short-subunit alcohol dehydrogenase family)